MAVRSRTGTMADAAKVSIKIASSVRERQQVFRIRHKVFTEEQRIPAELDRDGRDAEATHVLIYRLQQPVATGRLCRLSSTGGERARIAALPAARGSGLGKTVVHVLEAQARLLGLRQLALHPHAYLEKFYADLGYRKVGGIIHAGPHRLITMKKQIHPHIDESWYQKPDGIPEHRAAGGLVIRIDAGTAYLALIREGPEPRYSLPKGHIDPGESAVEAARREIAEEAGFSHLQFVRELGVRERLNMVKTSWKITHYFLFQTDEQPGTPRDPRHSGRAAWFAIDALPELFWPEQRDLISAVLDDIMELARTVGPE